ncbi:sulfatase-like hydrolase/transferase [Ferrimonas balearica]|uniref:sulfatase-like hydrolase/transferase n=1 Tax=Ferrimonas balearica TaxID=44012 RepID=UPI001C56C887|nr:sulfatase-like hydrolase/transferase [Ferrimonas balearica]MBW3162944.1 sulfatase-like hydrolase/transferase [Ferrimonas balearica]
MSAANGRETLSLGRDLYLRVLFILLYSSLMCYVLGGAVQGTSALAIVRVITGLNLVDFVSAGLIFDLLMFVLVVLLLHLIWAWVVAVSCLSGFRLSGNRHFRLLFGLFVVTLHLTLFVALNSLLYPTSLIAYFRGTTLATPLGAGLLLACSLLLWLYGLRLASERQRWVAAGMVSALVVLSLMAGVPSPQARPQSQPQVILVGIDGLRPDHLAYRDGPQSLMPAVNRFLDRARRYDRVYTPMARTHVAWISLLTGHYPRNHGVRFNLAPPEFVELPLPMVKGFNERGFHTLYAMDERRFNNIDQSYGFDEVVGPKAGAADTLITGFADLPIINLSLQLPFAESLFPYLSHNRAYGKAYSAHAFNEHVVSALDPDSPNFLALHMCLLHWPYTSREFVDIEPERWDGNFQYYMYVQMLKKQDAQFDHLLERLKQQGYLDNAIVVLFSDHGEGLGLAVDALNSNDSSLRELTQGMRGHGTSVLTQAQSDVVLALARYRDGRPVTSGTTLKGQFSLVDIAPTLYQALDWQWPGPLDGVPLPQTQQQVNTDRFVFVESSLSSQALSQSHIDVEQVLYETSKRYEVRQSGRVVFKTDNYVEQVSKKQLSVYGPGVQLVSLPELDVLLEVDLSHRQLRRLDLLQASPEIQALAQAACRFYGEEIRSRVSACEALLALPSMAHAGQGAGAETGRLRE